MGRCGTGSFTESCKKNLVHAQNFTKDKFAHGLLFALKPCLGGGGGGGGSQSIWGGGEGG